MTAPKLTGAQRADLEFAERMNAISTHDVLGRPEDLASLCDAGLLRETRRLFSRTYYQITDAGRIALRGDK